MPVRMASTRPDSAVHSDSRRLEHRFGLAHFRASAVAQASLRNLEPVAIRAEVNVPRQSSLVQDTAGNGVTTAANRSENSHDRVPARNCRVASPDTP